MILKIYIIQNILKAFSVRKFQFVSIVSKAWFLAAIAFFFFLNLPKLTLFLECQILFFKKYKNYLEDGHPFQSILAFLM